MRSWPSYIIHIFKIFVTVMLVLDLQGQRQPRTVSISKPQDHLELVNYQIVRFKLPQKNQPGTLAGQLTPGFRFTFRYRPPNQIIKGVSREMSHVELFGAVNNSQSGVSLERIDTGDDFFVKYRPADAGKTYYVTMDVPARSLISVGNQFRANGRIAFLTEKETAINTSRIVPLMIGQDIKAGPYSFEILELRKPTFGGDALELVLKPDQFTRENNDNILHINFFDQTGKTIRTKSKGSIGTEKFEKVVYSLNINPQKVVTEITHLKEKSYFMVPFEIKGGFELKVRN